MKKPASILFTILIHVLSGFCVAFLSSLLVYFKQKEVLHLVVVLIAAFTIYFTYDKMKSVISNVPNMLLIAAFIILFYFSILGAQFIYQIRPHTFYITGYAIFGILVILLTSHVLSSSASLAFPGNLFLFLISFGIGYFASWEISQIIVVGIAVLAIVLFNAIFLVMVLSRSIVITSALAAIVILYSFSKPMNRFDQQRQYEDKVLFTAQTQFHDLVITQWKYDYWIYLDKLKNMASIDEFLYYEPMAHALFQVNDELHDVLIIGGENGCLLREVLKHEEVQKVDILSYDKLLQKAGREMSVIAAMNQKAYEHKKVHVLHDDLLAYISSTDSKYDAVFIDLPDPRTIETNQFYTTEFYLFIDGIMKENGLMITQAGSPYFATQAYYSIEETIRFAGFQTLPIHNQILTLGEWGWFICSNTMSTFEMKDKLVSGDGIDVDTKWFNSESAKLVASFGKSASDSINVAINTLANPVIYKYFLKGNWKLD